MSLGWRARRRWALVVLLLGLPVYIAAAAGIVARLDRPGIVVELLVYAGLGVVWALPFRFLFPASGAPTAKAADGASESPSANNRLS